LTIPKSFARWSLPRKRDFFARAIESATEALGRKLSKTSQNYDFAGFQSDVNRALARWEGRAN
jgi:hypothetical protein